MWRLNQTKDHRAHRAQVKGGSIPKISARLLYARLGHLGKHMEGRLSSLMDDLGDH